MRGDGREVGRALCEHASLELDNVVLGQEVARVGDGAAQADLVHALAWVQLLL